MHKFFKAPVVWALLATLFMAPMATWAANNGDAADISASAADPNAAPEPVKINVPATLTALQKRLDTTKQQVSSAKTEKKLNGLNDDALEDSG